MKSKKNIYILFPAVLLIWGMIGYRIFSGTPSDDNRVLSDNSIKKFQPVEQGQNKILEINNNYRDPFLGELKQKLSVKTKRKGNLKTEEEIIFPNIRYKGFFKSSEQAKAVFLIEIDGEQNMFEKGELHHEIELISGDKEKIRIRFKQHSKVVLLKS